MSAPFQTVDPISTPDIGDDALTPEEQDEQELRSLLLTYWDEARNGRETGANPRDEEWRQNWDAYWSRYPMGEKAEWQSRQTLPEVPNFVERFVASIRAALVNAGKDWFQVSDPLDETNALGKAAKKVLDVMLDFTGTNKTGQPIGFTSPFAQTLKSGALMAMCGAVVWKDGRTRYEPTDPREIYLDPTGRDLYRIRRREIDWYMLDELKEKKDENGDPLYDAEKIDLLRGGAEWTDDRTEKRRSSGHGNETGQVPRRVVVLQEFLCKGIIELGSGKRLAKNQYVVLANHREIIRGPEPNPYKHGMDWIVYQPVIDVPFSTYGRSYVESFRQLAETFIETTNLILDGVFLGSMNAFMAWPDALEDPTQLVDGVHPNKVYMASDDVPAGTPFLTSVDLGQISPEAIPIWQGLRGMLREAASQNELQLGQLAPKGDTTATEVVGAQSGVQALNASISADIEEGFLEPVLELMWLTTLQELDFNSDPEIVRIVGDDVMNMLTSRRDDFMRRKFRFRVRGLSESLERAARARQMIQTLGIFASNEMMAETLNQTISMEKVLEVVFSDLGLDLEKIRMTPQEQQLKQMQSLMKQQGQGAPNGAGGTAPSSGSGPGQPSPTRVPNPAPGLS